MKNIRILSSLFFVLILMVSCTKDADSEGNLEGSFNVTKVEGQRYYNGSADIYVVDNNPTGYVKFNSGGSGNQDYTFTLYGNSSRQNSNFTWSADASSVYVKRYNQPDLVWERIENEKNKQVVSYDIIVDAQTTVKYTLTMEK